MSRDDVPRQDAREWAIHHMKKAWKLCRKDPDRAVRHLAEARKLMNRFNMKNRDIGFSNTSVVRIEKSISKAYTEASCRK